MATVGLALVAACMGMPARGAGPDGAARVERAIARMAPDSGGTVGVTAIHIETGRRISFNGGERFPMASTYKFPIALRLLRMVDRGELRLDRTLTLGPSDFRLGATEIADLARDSAVTMTVGRLLELMVAQSDNTATDALMKLAGGPATVTARLRELGVTGVDVSRYEVQLYFAGTGIRDVPPESEWTIARLEAPPEKIPVEEQRAANDRYATDPRDTTTPDAMADLLARAFRGETLSREGTDRLLEILESTTTGPGCLKGRLPQGTVVAHKTGQQGGSRNDVGVITLPDGAGHVAIAVYVKGSPKEVPDRERVIADIARTVYDYFLLAGD